MKDETAGVAIKEFIRLTPKMYTFLIDNGENKNGKGVNRVVIISLTKYKDVLLKNKCIRYSINRIQSKDHRIRAYEINKIFDFSNCS